MIRPHRLPAMLLACWLLLAFAAPTVQAQQGHSLPPMATPAAATVGDGWRIADVQALDNRTTPVALSPDGQWIAGIDEEDRFCVWDAATLEPTCDAGDLTIHPESIAWAPDSTAVAWSLDAFRLIVESDIYVFEVATGKSVNLTNDEVPGEEHAQQYITSSTIDVMPTWSRDSRSITFARAAGSPDQPGTTLMTIPRSGGEPEPRHTVAQEAPLSIATLMFHLSDGSLLYAVTSTSDHPEQGLWLLEVNGAARQILPGRGMPVIADVVETENGTLISGFSLPAIFQLGPDEPFSFVLELESGEMTPLVHPDDETTLLYPAGFSPGGSSTISVTWNPLVLPAVVVLGPEVSETPLPESVDIAHGSLALQRAPDWVGNNTILVSGFSNGAFLITVEPVT